MQLSFASHLSPTLEKIRARLLAVYGPQRDAWRLDPVSQLVLAILSARTRDEVSHQTFEDLRSRYDGWQRLSRASPREVERIIHLVTFADRKAVQLPRALAMIITRTGRLDLDFLAEWQEPPALAWLQELPGVGMRNAATTLNFSKLRKRVLSVGTQHLRVGQRLGFLPPGVNYATGFAIFMRLVPDAWDADDLYELHWLMKYHGQRTCTHFAPACTRCPLRDLCPQILDFDHRLAH